MEIVIPQQLADPLLIKAAEQEIPVEEIVEQAVKKYIERNDEIACLRKERNYCSDRR